MYLPQENLSMIYLAASAWGTLARKRRAVEYFIVSAADQILLRRSER